MKNLSTVLEFSNFEIFGKFIIVVGQFLKNLEKNLEKKICHWKVDFNWFRVTVGIKYFSNSGETRENTMRKRINEDQDSRKRRFDITRTDDYRQLSTISGFWKTRVKIIDRIFRGGRYEQVYKMTYFPSTRLHFFPDKILQWERNHIWRILFLNCKSGRAIFLR